MVRFIVNLFLAFGGWVRQPCAEFLVDKVHLNPFGSNEYFGGASRAAHPTSTSDSPRRRSVSDIGVFIESRPECRIIRSQNRFIDY